MTEAIASWPVWLAFAVLFCGAMMRGGATYVVGRGLRRGGEHSRWARQLDRPMVARAQDWLGRWGPPVVALSFLTVGVQTAVNAGAGALRMPVRRYLPGLVVGALMWAAVYVTVGLAVLEALLGRLPWWSALIAVGVVLLIVLGSRTLRRRAVDPAA